MLSELIAPIATGALVAGTFRIRGSSARTGIWDVLQEAVRGRFMREMEREYRTTLVVLLDRLDDRVPAVSSARLHGERGSR